MPRASASLSVVTAIGLALTLGCGPSRSFELAPVSGVVTLDGEPLAGGVVSFQPQSGAGRAPGPGSTGHLDDAGRYTLQTIEGEPGAVVATHRVRIYSVSSDQPVASDVDAPDAPRERVPDRYNYRSTLTFEVPAAGAENADFALTTEQE
ncbi:MAG: hypothetical protein CMJ58_26675 [Planctomycetaceae bacterium]|nr:hypothetical protein [Planctomycetaceae bacterium]